MAGQGKPEFLSKGEEIEFMSKGGESEFMSKGVEYLPMPMSSLADLSEYVSSLRSTNDHSDVTVTCRGSSFPVHKVVLCGRSSFFRKMLVSQQTDSDIKLDFDPDLFEFCLDYIYTGTAKVDTHLAGPLEELSSELGIIELSQLCARYQLSKTTVTVDNCIEVWNKASSLDEADVVHESLGMILDNFDVLQTAPAFRKLPYDRVVTILSHPDLSVTSPDERLLVAQDWVGEDAASRGVHLCSILESLPLLEMSDLVLKRAVRVDKLFKGHPEACKVINLAINNGKQNEHCFLIVGAKKFSSGTWQPALKDVYLMSTSLSSECKTISELPASVHERGRIACCKDGNRVYVSGLGDSMKEVWVFDYKSCKWRDCGELSAPHLAHCMICINGDLTVLGGGPFVASREMHENVEVLLKGSTSTWRTAGKLQGSECDNTCCCLLGRNEVLVYGGETGSQHTLQVYSTASRSVTHSLTVSPGNCWAYGVLVVEDTVVMMSYHNTYTCSVESLRREDTSSIKTCSKYRTPNYLCAVVLSEDSRHVILVGGAPRNESSPHYTYRAAVSDILNNTGSGWEKMKEMWQHGKSRIRAGAVSCGMFPSTLIK